MKIILIQLKENLIKTKHHFFDNFFDKMNICNLHLFCNDSFIKKMTTNTIFTQTYKGTLIGFITGNV